MEYVCANVKGVLEQYIKDTFQEKLDVPDATARHRSYRSDAEQAPRTSAPCYLTSAWSSHPATWSAYRWSDGSLPVVRVLLP